MLFPGQTDALRLDDLGRLSAFRGVALLRTRSRPRHSAYRSRRLCRFTSRAGPLKRRGTIVELAAVERALAVRVREARDAVRPQAASPLNLRSDLRVVRRRSPLPSGGSCATCLGGGLESGIVVVKIAPGARVHLERKPAAWQAGWVREVRYAVAAHAPRVREQLGLDRSRTGAPGAARAAATSDESGRDQRHNRRHHRYKPTRRHGRVVAVRWCQQGDSGTRPTSAPDHQRLSGGTALSPPLVDSLSGRRWLPARHCRSTPEAAVTMRAPTGDHGAVASRSDLTSLPGSAGVSAPTEALRPVVVFPDVAIQHDQLQRRSVDQRSQIRLAPIVEVSRATELPRRPSRPIAFFQRETERPATKTRHWRNTFASTNDQPPGRVLSGPLALLL